jgi:hypothetical protein
VDTDHLCYKFMNNFDRAMNLLDEKYNFLSSSKQIVSFTSETDKLIVFERADLVFVFNFHPKNTYEGIKVGCDLPGKYRVALDSDHSEFGGHGRVGHDIDHFTSPEGVVGKPETNFKNRPHSFFVLSPCRSCQVRAFPQKNKVDNITCTAHLLLFAPNATKLISMFCRVVSPIFLSADDISEISITLLLNHTSILFFC